MSADDGGSQAEQPTWSVTWEEGPEGLRFTADGRPAVTPLLTEPDVQLLLLGLEQLPDGEEVSRLRSWLRHLHTDLRHRR